MDEARTGQTEPRPLTRRRIAAIAAGNGAFAFVMTAHSSLSWERGLAAFAAALPLCALGIFLAARSSSAASQVAGLTVLAAVPFLCTLGIGRSIPRRGGPVVVAPTGEGLVFALGAIVVIAFLLAFFAVAYSRRKVEES
jgi:lysylphosphatidylglycerol synthetase-like protein (DUF2156 family)